MLLMHVYVCQAVCTGICWAAVHSIRARTGAKQAGGLASLQVNLTQLRKLAAVRGLVNSQLRQRVWPLLLGVQLQPFDDAKYQQHAVGKHRDSQARVYMLSPLLLLPLSGRFTLLFIMQHGCCQSR